MILSNLGGNFCTALLKEPKYMSMRSNFPGTKHRSKQAQALHTVIMEYIRDPIPMNLEMVDFCLDKIVVSDSAHQNLKQLSKNGESHLMDILCLSYPNSSKSRLYSDDKASINADLTSQILLKTLFKKVTDPEVVKFLLLTPNLKGITPLYEAIRSGNIDNVDFILKQLAKINLQNIEDYQAYKQQFTERNYFGYHLLDCVLMIKIADANKVKIIQKVIKYINTSFPPQEAHEIIDLLVSSSRFTRIASENLKKLLVDLQNQYSAAQHKSQSPKADMQKDDKSNKRIDTKNSQLSSSRDSQRERSRSPHKTSQPRHRSRSRYKRDSDSSSQEYAGFTDRFNPKRREQKMDYKSNAKDEATLTDSKHSAKDSKANNHHKTDTHSSSSAAAATNIEKRGLFAKAVDPKPKNKDQVDVVDKAADVKRRKDPD